MRALNPSTLYPFWIRLVLPSAVMCHEKNVIIPSGIVVGVCGYIDGGEKENKKRKRKKNKKTTMENID